MSVRPGEISNEKRLKKSRLEMLLLVVILQFSVRSAINTLTKDVDAMINQIKKLEEVGADLVRVSCPDEESSKALKI